MKFLMMMKKVCSMALASAMLMAVSMMHPAAIAQTAPILRANRVVIIPDMSGSYGQQIGAAMAKTQTLLDDIGKLPHRRGEKALDDIIILSLDAYPEVVWRGSRKELNADASSMIKARLLARKQYALCTDVHAALTQAAEILHAAPLADGKYLFAFSDLVHEPTKKSGACLAAKSPSVPDDEFPWAAFRDVSVSVMGVPFLQKLAWADAAKKHGLDNFHLYTTDEASVVKITAPPKPEHKMTDEEKAQVKNRLAGFFSGALYVAAGVLTVAMLFCIVVYLWARTRRRAPAHGRIIAPSMASPVPPQGRQ